ncbi:MAG TPA: hypothetical protein VGE37_13765 [Archangium sp.]
MGESTVKQGKSAVFWVIIATAGACAICSVFTFALIGLGLLTADAPTSPVAAATSKLQTGQTPHLFPGMPGWLPSGQGVSIPTAEEVDGEPRGLWWSFELNGNTTVAAMALFLEDGTYATHPRFGGGMLFDVEGQRAQKGNTGVGTYRVEDGKISQDHDGFKSRGVIISFDSDEGGPFMMIGSTKYWPLSAPNENDLVGTWRTAGGKYVFRDDGTFESGQVDVNGAYTVAVGGQGRWLLEGYLLQVSPNGAPGWITPIGATGDRFLVIGTRLYDRE